MLISMTPNEEVKTIHASLNDGKLRKWEFEPYTEQGKIELTDQDYATIQSIKGNTVKFNQLVQNGNFADTSVWEKTSTIAFTVNNNIASVVNSASNDGYVQQNIPLTSGHKYFYKLDCKKSSNDQGYIYFYFGSGGDNVLISVPTSWVTRQGFFTCVNNNYNLVRISNRTANLEINVANIVVFDLTAMGIDNLTTVEQVEQWLSNNIGLLPYYDYTLGSLISFNGTGLKTTGKNLIEEKKDNWNIDSTGTIVTAEFPCFIAKVKKGKNYTFSSVGDLPTLVYALFYNYPVIGLQSYNLERTVRGTNSFTFTSPIDGYIVVRTNPNSINQQLEIGSTATEYESYTESTLSLPISTYFPTGMKKAGSVYDEISDKAYTKVGSVDMGTLDWAMTQTGRFRTGTIDNLKYVIAQNDVPNAVCPIYKTGSPNDTVISSSVDDVISVGALYNAFFVKDTSYSTVESFKQAMSGVMVYYELATPTSQDISLDLTYPIWNNGTEQILPVNTSTPTTSSMKATIDYPDRTEDVNFLYKQTTFESAIPQFSLVCKNQELPMTLENDKLICECDSSITNESGFFDCKVKMQDLESVAYSQKIQLHVERGIND